MKRHTLLIALLLACACSKPPSRERPPPVVHATKAVTMDIPLFYDYIGHGDSNSSVDVYAQVAGKLTAQKYTGGDLIRAGDVLFTIDSRQYVVALQKAQSELEKNSVILQFAKEKAQSYTELIKDDIVSQLEFDSALTDVLTTDALIQQNKADIDLAKLNIQWCTVRAPITGITSLSSIGVGTYVPVGGNTPLVTIKQSVPLSLNFYVPEAHYLKIRALKNQGPVRVQAFSDDEKKRVYEGTLTLINYSMDKKTGTLWMQASFPNNDASMWPDEYFLTRVHLGIEKGATVIPNEAIVKTQQGNTIYVIKEDSTVEARLIETGETYRDLIIVTKGLSPDEVVVIEGQINLSPGVKVTIKDHKLTPVEEIEKTCPEGFAT